jgi:hypothetical protein
MLIACLWAGLAAGCARMPGGEAPPPESLVQSYEAESPDNEFGPAVTTGDEDVGGLASGGAYVGYVGNGPQEILRFKNVNVRRAGSYVLTIYYWTAEDRPAYVKVNDGEARMTDFPATGDYSSDTMDTVELTIDLKQGANTIELGNATYYAPDIDRIVIRPAE